MIRLEVTGWEQRVIPVKDEYYVYTAAEIDRNFKHSMTAVGGGEDVERGGANVN